LSLAARQNAHFVRHLVQRCTVTASEISGSAYELVWALDGHDQDDLREIGIGLARAGEEGEVYEDDLSRVMVVRDLVAPKSETYFGPIGLALLTIELHHRLLTIGLHH
jgi:hypothetical protein